MDLAVKYQIGRGECKKYELVLIRSFRCQNKFLNVGMTLVYHANTLLLICSSNCYKTILLHLKSFFKIPSFNSFVGLGTSSHKYLLSWAKIQLNIITVCNSSKMFHKHFLWKPQKFFYNLSSIQVSYKLWLLVSCIQYVSLLHLNFKIPYAYVVPCSEGVLPILFALAHCGSLLSLTGFVFAYGLLVNYH